MTYKYDGRFDPDCENNSWTQVYRMIRADAVGPRRILEVGCATGTFGAVLKGLGHQVWGVEMASEAAAVAQTRLDFVFNGSIENFFRDPSSAATFDYILFGDVLEHVLSPSNVLDAASSFLAERGAIIASIPNVAHLSVRLMLMEGRWNYDRIGLLDETHIRFFTRASIVDLFSAGALAIEQLGSIRQSVYQAGIAVSEPMIATFAPLLDDPESDVFQYIVLARKATAEQAAAQNAAFRGGSARIALSPDEVLQKTRDQLAEKERQLMALTHAHTALQQRLLELGEGLATALSVTRKVERKLARVKKYLSKPRQGWRRCARNLLLRII